MRTRLMAAISSAAAALMLCVIAASPASAQGAKTSVCKDGTQSTATGKGACSGHGGVDTKVTSSLAKANKTADKADAKAAKADAKAVSKADEKIDKADAKAAKTEAKADQKVVKAADKAEAKMVKCTDGTMSKGGRGACSGHGGIAKPGA